MSLLSMTETTEVTHPLYVSPVHAAHPNEQHEVDQEDGEYRGVDGWVVGRQHPQVAEDVLEVDGVHFGHAEAGGV